LVGFVVVLVQGEVAEEVGVVSIRAGGGAFLDGMKGFEEGFGANGEGRSLLVLGAGSSLVVVWGRCVRGVCAGVESGVVSWEGASLMSLCGRAQIGG
jgi:hypothetical protein